MTWADERYDLMMRRERWRGIGEGAYLTAVLLLLGTIACAVAGIEPLPPLWVYGLSPVGQGLAVWRLWVARKGINAVDARAREAAKQALQPVDREKTVN